MTVENISWSISTKECCRPRRGLNPRPPCVQSDGASNWATEAGVSLTTYSALQRLNRLHLHIRVSWSTFTVCLKTLCIYCYLQCPAKTLIRLHLHIRVSWSRFTACLKTLCILGYLQCPAKTLIRLHLHILVSWSTFTVCLKTLCIPCCQQSPAKTYQTAPAHQCKLINFHCLPEDTLYPLLPTVPCKGWSDCTCKSV